MRMCQVLLNAGHHMFTSYTLAHRQNKKSLGAFGGCSACLQHASSSAPVCGQCTISWNAYETCFRFPGLMVPRRLLANAHLGGAGQAHGQGKLPAGLDWNAPVAAIGQTAHSFLHQVKGSCDACRIPQHSLKLHARTAADESGAYT